MGDPTACLPAEIAVSIIDKHDIARGAALLEAFNAAIAAQKARRAEVLVTCLTILAHDIAGAGDIADDMRAGLIALMDTLTTVARMPGGTMQ